jgi:hypothetical protein
MDDLEPELRLNRSLSRLSRADLQPLAAALQLKAARERLKGPGRLSRIDRAEPAILIACGAAHLIWVLWRVLEVTLHS